MAERDAGLDRPAVRNHPKVVNRLGVVLYKLLNNESVGDAGGLVLDRKFKSIVDELCDYVPHNSRDHFIETRAQQVIASFTNLKTLIESNYDAETADELFRRLINAAKSGDERKFTRKVRELRESKAKEKNSVGEKRTGR